MDLHQEKILLRERIAERMDHLSPQKREAESRSLCRRIKELLPAHTKTICAYYPLATEADIRPLLCELLQKKIHLYLPRFTSNTLTYHRVTDVDALVIGELKIKEPSGEAESLDPLSLDLALVPGRAFDRDGWRLGRGNGGYDIWIHSQRSLNPKTLFWGIAFDCQIAREVPHEGHDEKMDAVVTGRGLLQDEAKDP